VEKVFNPVKVIRNLFSEDVHLGIKNWIENVYPNLSSERETVFSRTVAHNPGFMVDIHSQLEDFASEIFGEPVQKSYCFVSSYDEHGVCPLHIDRPQCRWTLDYLIDQSFQEPWPLFVSDSFDEPFFYVDHVSSEEDKNEVIKYYEWHSALMFPNDAACYSGTNQWHFRQPIPNSGSATLVFFHFVPKDFNGPLD
jgi:hypothetical protein